VQGKKIIINWSTQVTAHNALQRPGFKQASCKDAA